jgi:hypothetical protein
MLTSSSKTSIKPTNNSAIKLPPETVTDSIIKSNIPKQSLTTSLSSAFQHQKRSFTTIEHRMSSIRLSDIRTTRTSIRSTSSSLGKRLDLSSTTTRIKPVIKRNPFQRPVFKLSANLVQTYIKINETYFTQQSKMRLRRNIVSGSRVDAEEPPRKVLKSLANLR